VTIPTDSATALAPEVDDDVGEGTARLVSDTIYGRQGPLDLGTWSHSGPNPGSLVIVSIQKVSGDNCRVVPKWLGFEIPGRVEAVLVHCPGSGGETFKRGPNWCTSPYGLGCRKGQINPKV
jgi:hypothetical protein